MPPDKINDIATQAVNFTHSGRARVDPRTGQFLFDFPVANLTGKMGMGPTYSFVLSYNSLRGDMFHLGTGISLSLSTLDPKNQRLFLQNGMELCTEAIPASGDVLLRQNHLDIVHIIRGKNGFQIYNKSGDGESLSLEGFGDHAFHVTTSLSSPLGYRLWFDWGQTSAGPRLNAVSGHDHKTQLCALEYDDTKGDVRIKLFPASPAEAVVLLLRYKYEGEQRYLSSIYNEAASLEWALEYEKEKKLWINDRAPLVAVTLPTGLVERVIYMLPDNTPAPRRVPVVKQWHRTTSSGQPSLYASYTWSTNNFLGYSSTVSAEPEDDILYHVPDSYSYWSAETQPGPDPTSDTVITRTYGAYHLLLSETVLRGKCKQTRQIKYYARPGISFEDQPITFQMPASQSRIWTDGLHTRTEQTTFEYDEHGNLIRQIGADGSVVLTEYYPAEGATVPATGQVLCPPEPHGFCRFIKNHTVLPSLITGDEPAFRTEYTYTQIDTLPGSMTEHAIQLASTVHYSGRLSDADPPQPLTKPARLRSWADYLRTQLSQTDFHYETKKSSPYYGLLQECSFTLYDLTDPSINTVSRRIFTFEEKEGMLYETVTDKVPAIAGNGSSQTFELSVSSVKRAYTGLTLSETDAAGNNMQYEYDSIGRLIKRIEHPDKPLYTSHVQYLYVAPNKKILNYPETHTLGKELSRTLFTDIRGNLTLTGVDGLGRTIAKWVRDPDGSLGWQKISACTYDVHGRNITTSCWDYVLAGQADNTTTVLNQHHTLTYDDWGGVMAVMDQDGITHFQQRELVPAIPQAVWRTTAWHTGKDKLITCKEVVLFDNYNCPVRSVVLDKNNYPYSATTRFWDGIGRLCSKTDALGHTTRWTYDDLGRIRNTYYPGNTGVHLTYAPSSRGKLIVGISVSKQGGAQISLGSQKFDGLGRLVSTRSGGRTTSFTYDKPWQITPSSRQGPDGTESRFTQDPLLGGAITDVNAPGINQTFHFDPKTGQLIKSEEGAENPTLSMFRAYPSGRLKTESTVVLSATGVDTEWVYSLGGLPVTLKEEGVKETRSYQATGRPEKIVDDAVEVFLTYDALGRLSSWTATERLTKAALKTSVTYDDFGRETLREIDHTNGIKRRISQQWDVNNRLEGRQHFSDDKLMLDERYTYDERNRLSIYTCDGEALPSDPYGNSITQQKFTFDVLNNITICLTKLSNGSSNEARFFFSNTADPCQLTGLTNGIPERPKEAGIPSNVSGKTPRGYPSAIRLRYDGAGRMTEDEMGRKMTYDALGRLSSVSGGQYGYDAHNRMVYQKVDKTQTAHRLYYRGDQLVREWLTSGDGKPDASKDSHVRLVYAGGHCLAQETCKGASTTVMLTSTNADSSVISTTQEGKTQDRTYGPYGYSKDNGEM